MRLYWLAVNFVLPNIILLSDCIAPSVILTESRKSHGSSRSILDPLQQSIQINPIITAISHMFVIGKFAKTKHSTNINSELIGGKRICTILEVFIGKSKSIVYLWLYEKRSLKVWELFFAFVKASFIKINQHQLINRYTHNHLSAIVCNLRQYAFQTIEKKTIRRTHISFKIKVEKRRTFFCQPNFFFT